jgi:hypothetical protein
MEYKKYIEKNLKKLSESPGSNIVDPLIEIATLIPPCNPFLRHPVFLYPNPYTKKYGSS